MAFKGGKLNADQEEIGSGEESKNEESELVQMAKREPPLRRASPAVMAQALHFPACERTIAVTTSRFAAGKFLNF